jgi:hypothetical protein
MNLITKADAKNYLCEAAVPPTFRHRNKPPLGARVKGGPKTYG